MHRNSRFLMLSLAAGTIAVLAIAACNNTAVDDAQVPTAAPPAHAASEEEHGHKPGAHGGNIVSLGSDNYHVEAIVTNEGALKLYTLGKDETRIQDVEIQELIAYVKPAGGTDSAEIKFQAQPQPGDAAGKASLFVAQLPAELVGQAIDVTVPNIAIAGERFRLGFSTQSEQHADAAMPDALAGDEEKTLYLTPGGIYTQADIAANGAVTASQKFAKFKPTHDLNPKIGEKICPITLTKANPECAWIIGGKTYEFCCPPCVHEFVNLAKTKPEEIKEPSDYVQRAAGGPTEK